MGAKERKVELYLSQKIQALGGRAYKWISPGRRGVPDRICVLPKSLVIFVETKAPGGTTSELQNKELEYLKYLGHLAFVIETPYQVDMLVAYILKHYENLKKVKGQLDDTLRARTDS
jgi:hypothetical protein